jgi:hypothetical protein
MIAIADYSQGVEGFSYIYYEVGTHQPCASDSIVDCCCSAVQSAADRADNTSGGQQELGGPS